MAFACSHGFVLQAVRQAVRERDYARERDDYCAKLIVVTFAYYHDYFVYGCKLQRNVINEAFDYDVTLLDMLAALIRRGDVEALKTTLSELLFDVPAHLFEPWLDRSAASLDEMFTRVFCAGYVTARHVRPLVAVAHRRPRHLYEYMCYYNRAWVLFRGVFDNDMCCEASRVLYAVKTTNLVQEEIVELEQMRAKLCMMLRVPCEPLRDDDDSDPPLGHPHFQELFHRIKLDIAAPPPSSSSSSCSEDNASEPEEEEEAAAAAPPNPPLIQ